jgi:hypothetical protein
LGGTSAYTGSTRTNIENETSAWESEILAVEEKSREDTGPGTLAGAEKTGSRTLDLGTGGHTTRRADQQKTDAG